MGFHSPARRLGSQIASPLRSTTPRSPTYREVLSPSRPAAVLVVDPEPGEFFRLWTNLAPHMGNIAGGSDWHPKYALICQKYGSTVGTAASEFSSQNQWHAVGI